MGVVDDDDMVVFLRQIRKILNNNISSKILKNLYISSIKEK
jgi:hypothetical protein